MAPTDSPTHVPNCCGLRAPEALDLNSSEIARLKLPRLLDNRTLPSPRTLLRKTSDLVPKLWASDVAPMAPIGATRSEAMSL
eukprot:15467424-Alexandrium_andersonii.AAC.1